MTHHATAPVIPDVSVQVDDVDACHAAAVQAAAEIVYPLTLEPWGPVFTDGSRRAAVRPD